MEDITRYWINSFKPDIIIILSNKTRYIIQYIIIGGLTRYTWLGKSIFNLGKTYTKMDGLFHGLHTIGLYQWFMAYLIGQQK
jgi:hypothetical protein